jgi:UDP-N-acetylglucosamine--N-acetylmuramyl-(pentapeptide) pyrophosphoryl-undecaprenol N-acetylglucosamine transferase
MALGLPVDGQVVAAFGGSLGARHINETIVEMANAWKGRNGVAVHHIVGARDWKQISGACPDLPDGGLVYQQVQYEHRMPLVYAAADVAVCRAGASTVAELAAVGLPAVLVPLPGAPGDHQTANARALAGGGAALVISDGELDAARLATELSALLGDRSRLQLMSEVARQLAHPDAAAAVARLAEEHARG